MLDQADDPLATLAMIDMALSRHPDSPWRGTLFSLRRLLVAQTGHRALAVVERLPDLPRR